MFASLRRVLNDSTPGVRSKVISMYALLLSANVLLWVITLLIAMQYPVILALAVPAYTLGLRHAFDADHIAAIDNVTRKLMQEKKRPVAVGLFFSLGHSTVVFLIAVLVGVGASFIRQGISNQNSPLENTAGLIGPRCRRLRGETDPRSASLSSMRRLGSSASVPRGFAPVAGSDWHDRCLTHRDFCEN
jgi:high-affinity nickel-transport protein